MVIISKEDTDMSKIKFMADSACDISKEDEKKYDIKVLCFPITVGEKSFYDRDMNIKEYYDLIMSSTELPKHSQLTPMMYKECYEQYWQEGYSDVIYTAIASKGSNTINSAMLAREQFYEENPQAKESMSIRILDSGNYTGTIGYPLIQAAVKANNGASADEIEGYLKEWYSKAEVHFGTFSLEFVKKSGRVSSAAGFVGEVLGLRPIICIKQGVSTVEAKVRGDKAVVPKLADMVCERIIPDSPYVVMEGYDPVYTDEITKELTKRLGYPPEMRFDIGGVIAANCGPKTVAVAFKGKD